MLGLPYAFASHFAPEALLDAVAIYRERFTPSATLDKPYVMVGVMGSTADTDEEAQYHFTSAQQQFVNLRRNVRGPFPRPRKDMDDFWTPMEKLNVENTLRYAVVGSPATAEAKLRQFIRDTEADEVIISMPIHDIEARLRSVELFATLPSFKKVS
jgi:luciferase family oxidoreductase group 1